MTISVEIIIFLVKTLTKIYDIITFPLYLLIQKPWKSLNSRPKSRLIREDNGLSYWMRYEDKDLSKEHFISKCQTVPQLFLMSTKTFGDKKCFGRRALLREEDERQSDGKVFKKLILDSQYYWFSYKQIAKRVTKVSKTLKSSSIGVKFNENVVIFAETRVEWMISAQALLRLGAPIVTLYSTLGEEALLHGINETEARVVITTSDLLSKLRLSRLPLVRHVIYMEGVVPPPLSSLFTSEERKRVSFRSFSALESEEQEEDNEDEEEDKSLVKSESTAVLMYTSGSTGVPKAVMISHKNLLNAVKAFFTISHALSKEDVYCAYLPLAHVLEMSAELFFFSLGLSVGFASPLTLTDSSTAIKSGQKGDVSLLKPTVLCAVPLILDRIRKAIEQQTQQKGLLAKTLFNFSIDYKKAWTQRGFKTPIIDFLVCRRIRALLGGRIRLLAVGSAPLAPETQEFIRTCLNVELLQGYGLTETSASATLQDIGDLSVGSVGAPLTGVRIRLVDWLEGNYRISDKPNPRGEVVIASNAVTNGYYLNEKLTKESFKEEKGMKWFYTGDIGEMSSDGCLRIIDRKKDLVKLQQGEYVSLGKIESLLKGCPLVDNICVYGDSLKTYLIALVVPNQKAIQIYLESNERPLKELCRDRQVVRRVQEEIYNFGLKVGLHKHEIPFKIHLVSDEWLPDSGLVTAALKLRRKNIQDYYQIEINSLYSLSSSQST